MTLRALLEASAKRHSHLCPRQVLGVRMGLLAGELLDLDVPRTDKRLLTIVETDGCAADGVAVATGCSVGHRTLRLEDFGKVAATFVDSRLDHAVRIAPQPWARRLAADYAPAAPDRWQAQVIGYQTMPSALLLGWRWVDLIVPVRAIISRPDARAVCAACREEISNEREVLRDGAILCRACAGHAYYRPAAIEDAADGWFPDPAAALPAPCGRPVDGAEPATSAVILPRRRGAALASAEPRP